MLNTFSFKGFKHGELLFGRNKLFSLMLGKSQTSQLGGIINIISPVYLFCSGVCVCVCVREKVCRELGQGSSKREVNCV